MLTISTTHTPATDLGYLLHKNPANLHKAELSFGSAQVFFPEASEDLCTAALVLNIDPIALARERFGTLANYVNDRPYVTSSFVSVAIADLFSTAMNGKSRERPELVGQPIPLAIRLPVLPSRSGDRGIRELFEPLGYAIEATRIPLAPEFPEWGDSQYYDVELKVEATLQSVLRHLYVLLPVLDAKKHYFLGSDEVRKLLAKGEGWLEGHPKRDWIVQAYLGKRRTLIAEALEQLGNQEPELVAGEETTEAEEAEKLGQEEKTKKASLHQRRHARVIEIVRSLSPASAIDLGCGSGLLLRKLVPIFGLKRIVGMDVAYREVERAEKSLHLDSATPMRRERIEVFQGSLLYRDPRIAGFDVATVIEVIEHLDPPRLTAFEKVVFEFARPKTVILSTPNRAYNAVYEDVADLRHPDHRFEWDKDELAAWLQKMEEQFGYTSLVEGVGDEHDEFGPPSFLVVMTR